MPRTVDEGFNDFLDKLTPLKVESDAVKKHRESIKQCLENKFSLKNLFRTGSIGHGTSISGYSDVDYFAVIPREKLKKNSASSLREIKEAFIERFPNTVGIKVDSPAVVIPFGNYASEITEIIPADLIKSEDGFGIYEIPDGNGEWMKSSPHKHNEYVARVDKKLSGKVKPLIRFIKAWKYYRNVPISSFYLEMQVARYADNEKSIVYSIDVRNILKTLLNSSLADMVDPVGISGYIHACSSSVTKEDALSKLSTASSRADSARLSESNGNLGDAFYWWGLLFNDKFPSYYR